MKKSAFIIVLPFLFLYCKKGEKKSQKFDTMIIAHRGASAIAPENTLPAVDLAFKKDADAVEVDIHLTKDNHIVAIHDKNTKRTTDKDLIVKKNKYNTLKQLDAGKWKSDKYEGTKIPLLKDIISTIPQGKKLFIEIKCSENILTPLSELINNTNKKDQIVIIGFDFSTMVNAKKLFADIPVYYLKNRVTDPGKLIKKVKNNGLNGIDVHYSNVNDTLVKQLHNEKLNIFCYTVDDKQIAAQLIKSGVDGITTNDPENLKH